MKGNLDLKALKVAVEAACKSACENSGEISGSFNRGDLHCASVEYWEDEDGDWGWRAYVEEAAPCGISLIEYLGDFLEKNHPEFPPIEIRTEW